MIKTHDSEIRRSATPRHDFIPDRRERLRNQLRDAPGTLEWYDGDELVRCEMQILDISGGGIAVRAVRQPAAGQDVRITLASGALGTEAVKAKVVMASDNAAGMFVVRMQFNSWISVGTVLEEHQEHRRWQRYPVQEKRASVMWQAGDSVHTSACELINISGGGTAVFADTTPPDKYRLWLTLHTDDGSTTPVECRLVAASIDASGLQIVRLRFVEPCPMDLFELSIHGRSATR